MPITYEDNLKVNSAGAMVINLTIAGLGSRSYAFIIDWHIRVLIAMAWFIVVIFFVDLMSGVGGDFFNLSSFDKNPMGFYGFFSAILIYFLYHPVIEIAMKGRTPGKRIAGIRIVSIDGSVPSNGSLIIRNIFRIIDSLPSFYMVGISACFLTKKQVRVGDIAAHTVLVHEEKMESKAIEFIRDAARDSVLDHTQIEVLHDLLSRWKELERKSRVAIGQKLLSIAGVTISRTIPDSEQDQEIHTRLLTLAENNDSEK